MVKFVLLFFALTAFGPHQESGPFDTKEECEAARAELPKTIAEHNAAVEPKIVLYASVCVPLKPAPQGKSV